VVPGALFDFGGLNGNPESASSAPEGRREQDQEGEDLQAPEQHGDDGEQLAQVAHGLKIVGDLAETWPYAVTG
jgi:hypothetical protein